jgi:arylsulfatase A-like enzyme
MHGESSTVTVDAALEFIRKHAKSPMPFLAVVWFGSPHDPHQAAAEDRALYAGQPETDRDWLGEITGMDRAVGKLRAGLRALGIHENTILWYTSDNGGLRPESTGGRGMKGQVYEGGLRVPGLLEWPDRIPAHRATGVPCVTSDIYPTLLEIVGVAMPNQPPLDGISLVPLIDGKMTARPKPIGFWDHAAGGHSTPSDKLMAELLEAQQAGREVDPHTFGKDAGKITKQYPLDEFPGHAARLDWPWKLHRIQKKGAPKVELYDLARDPYEKNDLADQQADRVKAMRAALEVWLTSVVRSLNGEDYR